MDCLFEKLKKMWKSPHSWRNVDGKIEFSLSTSRGLEWFGYHQAPEKVELYIEKWKQLGGR